MVCSLVGYTKFLKRSWLETIYSWTANTGMLGCFPKNELEAAEEEYQMNIKQHSAQEEVKISENGAKHRVKRWEHSLQIDDRVCSLHAAGLTIGVIGLFLENFITTC